MKHPLPCADFRAVGSDEEDGASSGMSSEYSDAESDVSESEDDGIAEELDAEDEGLEEEGERMSGWFKQMVEYAVNHRPTSIICRSLSDDEEDDKPQDALTGKNLSIAKAFAKILDKGPKREVPTTASVEPPILKGSQAKLAKRKAEESASETRDKIAHKQLQEMRMRGHVTPQPRGTDPAADAEEKQLQKAATRGVVRLFNAISGAQRKRREEESGASRAARISRANLLEVTKQEPEKLAPESRGVTGLIPKRADSSDDEDAKQKGWEVLQKSFTGLEGKGRMKEWDQGEEGGEDSAHSDLESSDSE